MAKARNYRREYQNRPNTPEMVDAQNSRHKARRKVEKKLGKKLPTKMEVDHINGDSMDNADKNLRVLPQKQNRSKGATTDKVRRQGSSPKRKK